MTYWSAQELALMDVVIFETTDAKGRPIEFRTPACAKLVAKPRPLTWQVQQGLGLSGAVARFTGVGLSSGTITLTMALAEHRKEFDENCKRYLASPAQGQPARIFKVRHPRLARLGIWQIHLQDEPAGEWNEQAQIETVVYSWEEHRKPLPTLSSPATSGATKDGPTAKARVADGMAAANEELRVRNTELAKKLMGL